MFSLHLIPREHLPDLAAGRIPDFYVHRLAVDGLPPAVAVNRATRLLAAGGQELWCGIFLIVRDADHQVVGSCGFKGEPRDGQVEIGYGVSLACRRQGAATFAVRGLLDLAFAGGAASVLAEILPANPASLGVVQKLGFRPDGVRTSEHGLLMTRWLARPPG